MLKHNVNSGGGCWYVKARMWKPPRDLEWFYMTPCFVSSMVSLARTNSAKRCFAARLSLEVFCVLSLAAALWILDGSGHRRSNVKLRHKPVPPALHPFMCVFPRWTNCTSVGRERGFAIGVVACKWPWWAPPTRSVAQKKMKSSGRGNHLLHSHGRTKHLHPTKYAARNGAHSISGSVWSRPSLPKVKLLLQCFVNMTERDRLLFGGCLPCGRNLTLQAGWMPFLCCDVDSFTSSVLQVRCAKAYVRQTCADIADEAWKFKRGPTCTNNFIQTLRFAHDPCCRSTVDAKHAPSGARDASIAAAAAFRHFVGLSWRLFRGCFLARLSWFSIGCILSHV